MQDTVRPMLRASRSIAGWLLCGMMLYIAAAPAHAQTAGFPSRQMQIVVPFPAGGSADYFARAVANKLSPMTGHPVVINSPPDGHTLLVSSVASVTIPPAMAEPPAFDALKDLAPVTGIGMVPAVLVIKPSLGIRTFADFLNYAKANPGKINLASSGTGTISHLTAE